MQIDLALLGVFVLSLDFWAILRTLDSTAPEGVKLAWALTVVALPLAGLAIWAVAGPSTASIICEDPELD